MRISTAWGADAERKGKAATYNSPKTWAAGGSCQQWLLGNSLHKEAYRIGNCLMNVGWYSSPTKQQPCSSTCVGWGFDPGQGRCWIASGITPENNIAAQWRDDPGGCRLDGRPHTVRELYWRQQYRGLPHSSTADQELVHENHRAPQRHGQWHQHRDLAVTYPGIVLETCVPNRECLIYLLEILNFYLWHIALVSRANSRLCGLSKWLGLFRCFGKKRWYGGGFLETPLPSLLEEFKCSRVRLEMSQSESCEKNISNITKATLALCEIGGFGLEKSKP